MAIVDTTYVQERDGVLHIGDTRVTLHSLIASWQNEGYTAEELRIGFPTLSLAQVYGAIAYYLDHQSALDPLFAAENEQYAAQRIQARASDPAEQGPSSRRESRSSDRASLQYRRAG